MCEAPDTESHLLKATYCRLRSETSVRSRAPLCQQSKRRRPARRTVRLRRLKSFKGHNENRVASIDWIDGSPRVASREFGFQHSSSRNFRRPAEPPSLELVSWLPCRGHKENSSHAAHFQTSRGVCAAMVSCGIPPEANISIGCACARGAQHRARPLDQRTRGPASGCASIVSRY
jgi:hypothetical protein